MNLFDLGSLIRAIIFFWVSATSFSLFQLYTDGYKVSEKISPIIRVLIAILFWIFILFLYLSLTALASRFAPSIHMYLTLFMPVVGLPFGILLTKFRKESITRREKEK